MANTAVSLVTAPAKHTVEDFRVHLRFILPNIVVKVNLNIPRLHLRQNAGVRNVMSRLSWHYILYAHDILLANVTCSIL